MLLGTGNNTFFTVFKTTFRKSDLIETVKCQCKTAQYFTYRCCAKTLKNHFMESKVS